MNNVRLMFDDDCSGERPTYLDRAAALSAQEMCRASVFADERIVQGPAWNIMLRLFIEQERGIAVSTACVADIARVPDFLALRWLDVLEDARFIRRWNNETEPELALMSLTPRATEMMLRYLDAV